MKRSGFAKIGPELLDDERITLSHAKVYWDMARVVPKGTTQCFIGQRLIAKRRKVSVSTVCRRIADLIEWGHVKKLETLDGMRARYELTSVAFTIKQKEQRPVYAGGQKKTSGRMTETQKAACWNDSRAILDEILAG